MTLIPERFLRFAIRDLENKSDFERTEEHGFWLKRLHEYYAINHGDLKENEAIDKNRFIAEAAKEIENKVLVIDLHTIPELRPTAWNFALTGLDAGLKLRQDVHLEAEEWHSKVRIIFPLNTYTVSYSFFKGFLGHSVRTSGSVDAFFEKYTIEAPAHLTEVFRNYVQRIVFPF